MEEATYDLGNGLRIDAENPETHEGPNYCRDCGVFYYFGGHFCIENLKQPIMKRAMKGYYDGE